MFFFRLGYIHLAAPFFCRATMCGISGYFSPTQQITAQDLRLMNTAMAHRGPDADGFYFNASQTVGLGHRRLSIIDLSAAANQPMQSHCGRYWMVFNGEVYNFQQIAKALHIQPRTSSDTEIILEAFAIKGKECVHLFNGMFAIVIYDTQKNALHFFRDRLGVKPLYYFFESGNFCFGSEIKSLLQCCLVKQNLTINKNSAYTFLNAGYIPGPHTIYNQLKKFPSGSYGTLKNGELKIESYWKPEAKIETNTVNDFTNAKRQLNELLIDSVRLRMISDVPFGTFLSGGIDSSMVTAIAQKNADTPVRTFSIGFKEAKHNESEFARAVAKHLKTEHHEFTVTETDALNLVEQMLCAYDEPYADSSGIPTMLVSKLARQQVTMVLSGDGGDELFMGYGMYQWAKRMQHSMVKLFHKPMAMALSMGDNRAKRAAQVFNYSSSSKIKSHIFSQEQYFFSEQELSHLLINSSAQQLQFDETQNGLYRNLSAAEQQALYDIHYYLKDDLLVKVDIASMQYSLEARTPFLDYRIVEFALNLSEQLKVQNGISKYLLKEVLYDYVPRQIFDRPKWGFSIPLAKWLKTDLRFLITQYLNQETVSGCAVVHWLYVQNLLKRFEAGEDYLYNRVWALTILHRWLSKQSTT